MKSILKKSILMLALALPIISTLTINSASENKTNKQNDTSTYVMGESIKNTNALMIIEMKATITENGVKMDGFGGINVDEFVKLTQISPTEAKQMFEELYGSNITYNDINGVEVANVIDVSKLGIDLDKEINLSSLTKEPFKLPLSSLNTQIKQVERMFSDIPMTSDVDLVSVSIQIELPEEYKFTETNVGTIEENKLTYSFTNEDTVQDIEATVKKSGINIVLIGILVGAILLFIIGIFIYCIVKK